MKRANAAWRTVCGIPAGRLAPLHANVAREANMHRLVTLLAQLQIICVFLILSDHFSRVCLSFPPYLA